MTLEGQITAWVLAMPTQRLKGQILKAFRLFLHFGKRQVPRYDASPHWQELERCPVECC